MDYEMLIGELESYLEDMEKKSEESSARYFESKHFFMQSLGRTEQGKADAYHDVLCKLKELENVWSRVGNCLETEADGSTRK